MARPARNTRRGDEEFVNAALIALAVTKNFDLGEPETAKASPSAALGVLMLAIFERLQTGHPDVERIQRAHLEFEHTSEGFQFNSDIFPDHYLMIPHYTALTDEELASFQSIAYRALQGRAYFCAEQMMLAADPSAQLSEFPTRDDFVDLCEWLAREGFGTVASLDWVMQGDVLFGVETHLLLDLIKEKGPDAEIDARLFRPVLRHGQALATYTASLEGSISADNPCSARARALRDLAVGELKLLQRTLAQSFQVFEAVDTIKEPESVAARLSDAVGDGVLPATRALAAEHMGYLYNRAATVARTQDLAESFYSAAVACSHYAYETSGSPRHAKYVAQNMLEIASLRSDDVLKACAETVWVDAYVVPFHLGLHRPGSREFEDLGWTAPVYRLSDSRFDYTDIPPYSVDPTFVYEGSAAEGLREINPSFPPDLWAAAVLVVQRFKDLESPAASTAYDAALPLYVPGADGSSRFPMLRQHPVAWFFFLADRLLREHVRNRPHAGLVSPRQPGWEQRRWLEGSLDEYRKRLSGQTIRAARPRPVFPMFAAHLLLPVVDEWRESGRERLADQWSEVVRLWSAD